MININLGNIIGATTSIQGESTSTDSLSTWSDFIGEFELSLENNGDISNKIEGVDEGLIFVEYLPNVDAIFITKDNKIYLSKGIKNIFELQNEDFTLAN